MSDESNDSGPVDNAANLCNWLVVFTGLILIAALVVMQNLNAAQYNTGWLAK
ncbi:MAG: hypothetical protein K8T90_01830 [Planctomycetes bacterium]|nr:hypothetical protein [Planctomycetota bacterium]